MKKYKLCFEPFGLMLFLIIIIPNFIWIIKPAHNDILKAESLTPLLDSVMNVFQIIFVAAMCGIVNKDAKKLYLSICIIISVVSTAVYYVAWGLYFSGNISNTVIFLLTVSPCVSFIVYLIDRKNYVAFVPAIIFSFLHFLYAIINFIV